AAQRTFQGPEREQRGLGEPVDDEQLTGLEEPPAGLVVHGLAGDDDGGDRIALRPRTARAALTGRQDPQLVALRVAQRPYPSGLGDERVEGEDRQLGADAPDGLHDPRSRVAVAADLFG